MPSRAMSKWSKALPSCWDGKTLNLMVPFDAFSIDAPHSSIAFCSGCVGGTQCESLRSKVLSCASAADAPISRQATDAPHVARRRLPRCDDIVSSGLEIGLQAAFAPIQPEVKDTVK